MVRRPEARDEIKSFPARDATMVFMALISNHQHQQLGVAVRDSIPGDSRAVVSGEHEYHLNELGSPRRETYPPMTISFSIKREYKKGGGTYAA